VLIWIPGVPLSAIVLGGVPGIVTGFQLSNTVTGFGAKSARKSTLMPERSFSGHLKPVPMMAANTVSVRNRTVSVSVCRYGVPLPGVNYVEFSVGSDDSQMFLDMVAVAPEPTCLALVSFGALLLRRRR